MSFLTIIKNDEDDWSVWLHLERGHPHRQPHSFIIGTGHTRQAAVESAVTDLESVVHQLQRPRGAVREIPKFEAKETEPS